MKYKLIRSMAHNWSHSFMSWNNYLDGAHVFEDMYSLARTRRGEKVIVSWIPIRDDKMAGLTPRIRYFVNAYRSGLDKHLLHHKVELTALLELRTEVYVAGNFRMYVRAYALDDRGKEHAAFVWAS